MALSAGAIAGLGLAGDVIGGLFGKSGQSSANRTNLRIARENREWQERMSNTAYQRAAADLEKAGLNRILAIGQPSSTPAGNVATMQNENQGLQNAFSNTASRMLMYQQIKNMKAQEKLTMAQADALRPITEIGSEALSAKKRTTQFYHEEINNPRRSWSPTKEGQLKRPESAKLTPSIQKRHNEARLDRLADSLGLDRERSKTLLYNLLNEMDFPRDWTNQQKLDWAFENQDAVKRYLERRKNR